MLTKITFALFFCLSLLTGFRMANAQPAPKLYINFATHNEPTEDYSDPTVFTATAGKIKALADVMNSTGAKWNYQTTSRFLLDCLANPTVVYGSANVNIMAYITGHGGGSNPVSGVEIDPRIKKYCDGVYHSSGVCLGVEYNRPY